MIPVLVPALVETTDELGESTSVGVAASEVEVLPTEVSLSVDEVTSEVASEVASEVEVISAEVASSVEEVGFKVAVL